MAYKQSLLPSLTLSLFPISPLNCFIDLTDEEEEEEAAVILSSDLELVSQKGKSTADNLLLKVQEEKLTDEVAVISNGNLDLVSRKRKSLADDFTLKVLEENLTDEEAVILNQYFDLVSRKRKSLAGNLSLKVLEEKLIDEEAVITNRDLDLVSRKRKSPDNFFSENGQSEKKEKLEFASSSRKKQLHYTDSTEEESIISNRDFDSVLRNRKSPGKFSIEGANLNLISNMEEQQRSKIREDEFASSSRKNQLPCTDLTLSMAAEHSENRETGVSRRNSDTIIINKFHDRIPQEWLSLRGVIESEIHTRDYSR